MHQMPHNPKLDASVRALLDDLRRRIRRYVWVHGVGAAVACVGIAFWLSLVIDWFFEPAAFVRVLLLLAIAAAVVTVVMKLIVGRLRTPLPDASMALLIERRFPELDDTLLTAISLSREDFEAEPSEAPEDVMRQAAMFDRTCREANERIQEVRPGRGLLPP